MMMACGGEHGGVTSGLAVRQSSRQVALIELGAATVIHNAREGSSRRVKAREQRSPGVETAGGRVGWPEKCRLLPYVAYDNVPACPVPLQSRVHGIPLYLRLSIRNALPGA